MTRKWHPKQCALCRKCNLGRMDKKLLCSAGKGDAVEFEGESTVSCADFEKRENANNE